MAEFTRHFADADELLGAAWDDLNAELLTDLAEAFATAGEGLVDRARAVITTFVRSTERDPVKAAVALGDYSANAVLDHRRQSAILHLASLFATAFKTTNLRDIHIQMTTVHLVGGVFELMRFWRSGALDVTTDQIIEHAAHMVTSVTEQYV